MSSANQKLKQAFDLIKAKKKKEAVDILLPILKTDQDNADAWWLLANARDTPDDIREALENVLRLRPTHEKAQQMLDKLNQRYPPPKPKRDDEFTFDDDPFADDEDEYQPRVYKKGAGAVQVGKSGKVEVTKSKSGTSPLVIILAIIGVIAALGCIACLALPLLGITLFGTAVSQVVNDPTVQAAFNDPTVQAAFQDIADSITSVAGLADSQTLPTNLRMRGTIEPGQTVQGTVDTFDPDGWAFSGSEGRPITIELNALSDDLDPQLYFYNADGQLIAENDDTVFGENLNSHIEFTLTYSGSYTIVVSAFGSGGDYELTVR
jgi:hypothetical protein